MRYRRGREPVPAGWDEDASGTPETVLTEPMLRAVFGLSARIVADPVTGKPMMIPIGRHGARSCDAEGAMEVDS